MSSLGAREGWRAVRGLAGQPMDADHLAGNADLPVPIRSDRAAPWMASAGAGRPVNPALNGDRKTSARTGKDIR